MLEKVAVACIVSQPAWALTYTKGADLLAMTGSKVGRLH